MVAHDEVQTQYQYFKIGHMKFIYTREMLFLGSGSLERPNVCSRSPPKHIIALLRE